MKIKDIKVGMKVWFKGGYGYPEGVYEIKDVSYRHDTAAIHTSQGGVYVHTSYLTPYEGTYTCTIKDVRMNKKQFEKDMEKLIKAIKSDTDLCDALYKFCGGTIELWGLDVAIDLMDRIYSPKYCWISWWVMETDMGEREMEAGYNGKNKVIRTIDDLWELIREENRINQGT